MKNIDFLPDIYRQRAATLRARVWWGVLVVLFGAALGSTAIGQFFIRRSIEQQLLALEPRHAAAQEHVRKLTELNAQDRQAGELASLVTFLDHPWPRTQLLAEIVRPLPESVKLTELALVLSEIPQAVGEASAGPPPGVSAEASALVVAPAVHDLEKLRELHDDRETVIEITGQTTDIAPLHGYVAALARSTLVSKARLKSIESSAGHEGARTTRFTVLVVVRTCHGIRGGEQAKTALATQEGRP
ncbi:MAG: hypothetical protein SFU86_18640 [Pirellulaceae bacterium]|nr:hypothetical protein [Pirellulaceae bacterium]